MNAYIIERYRTLAATLFCVGVLPVAVICSFEGLSPDQALNKSFYLTFISILNRPMSVRQKAASWLLFSLFTIFRVGKDKGVISGRTIYRRISLQDQLREVIAKSFVTLFNNSWVMNTIAGAGGQRWLVVPYCWGFTCDLLAANEITNTGGQSNPADLSSRAQQGQLF
jgi:hypothetical protein